MFSQTLTITNLYTGLSLNEKTQTAWQWWPMPLFPALTLGRQRHPISEMEANLVYRVSSKPVRATQRKPILKNKTKPKIILE